MSWLQVCLTTSIVLFGTENSGKMITLACQQGMQRRLKQMTVLKASELPWHEHNDTWSTFVTLDQGKLPSSSQYRKQATVLWTIIIGNLLHNMTSTRSWNNRKGKSQQSCVRWALHEHILHHVVIFLWHSFQTWYKVNSKWIWGTDF